jgi:hypothetical protein
LNDVIAMMSIGFVLQIGALAVGSFGWLASKAAPNRRQWMAFEQEHAGSDGWINGLLLPPGGLVA